MLQVHDFNPRSREGSDTIWSDIVSRTGISIRAPARGATLHFLRHFRCHVNFSPRSREGSDSINFANCFCDTISIRAPARGATFNSPVNDPVLQFQSALPRGERPRFLLDRCSTKQFQSALPRGERHLRRKVPGHVTDFNPRSREGSDRIHTAVFSICNTISIRAPARGATQRSYPLK